MYLSGPSRRAANTRSTIIDDAFTGAPASALASCAALSAACPRNLSCPCTATIALAVCAASLAAFADLSRSAAAAASTGRSVSGSSRSRPSASAASIMAASAASLIRERSDLKRSVDKFETPAEFETCAAPADLPLTDLTRL